MNRSALLRQQMLEAKMAKSSQNGPIRHSKSANERLQASEVTSSTGSSTRRSIITSKERDGQMVFDLRNKVKK